MTSKRQTLGKWGESLAATYLSRRGYTILERNARTPYGEIDLVACQECPEGRVVVFVEVKTRSSRTFGYPEDSVTAQKQAHMLAAAQAYLQAHPELDGDWRVDVIAIRRTRQGQSPRIVHFENAVT